jgi:hypothetical protein
MAVLCREHRLLFIMVPCTGCSTIGKILRQQFGGEWLPETDLMRGSRVVLNRKHNSLRELVEFGVVTPDDLRGWLKFATIRNPFDRFASEYQRLAGEWMEAAMASSRPDSWVNRGGEAHAEQLRSRKLGEVRRARGEGFDRWLARNIGAAQRIDDRLRGWVKRVLQRGPREKNPAFPMIAGVDELMRYENLEADFNRVLASVGVTEFVPLPHTNKTPGKKPYQEYYSSQSRQLVEKMFAADLSRHGYSFE